MKSGQLTVATFSDVEKARAAKERLDAAGITAELMDESKLEQFWFLSKPLAGEKVRVDEKDFERARHVLEAADAREHVLACEVKCPQCGSPQVEYPQFSRKFLTTTLVEVFCLLHVIDRKFYCKSCHHSWSPEEKLRPTTDRLGWPEKDEAGLVKKEE